LFDRVIQTYGDAACGHHALAGRPAHQVTRHLMPGHRLRHLRFLLAHIGITCGQRVWNRHPEGGCSALGMSPDIRSPPRRAAAGCDTGTAAISACV
jgi:hypothetical protein